MSQNKGPAPEEMSGFFDARALTYDEHMLRDLDLSAFYDEIALCFNENMEKPPEKLLDIGCGTGLELEKLFELNPGMGVTGVDLSPVMLDVLKQKYSKREISLICGSYFDVSFGEGYDAAVSTYSLHHFSEGKKLSLFRRIFDALLPGGVFVLGDYTVKTIEEQNRLLDAAAKKRAENGIPDGVFVHIDTPFTAETEMKLLKSAGFCEIKAAKQWDATAIIVCRKQGTLCTGK